MFVIRFERVWEERRGEERGEEAYGWGIHMYKMLDAGSSHSVAVNGIFA